MPLKTSLIRQRVADFLKSHQPFGFFSSQLALAFSTEAIAPPFATFIDKNAGKLYIAR
ncbi:MAG: hypothetical protein ACREX9_20200 [Gammaproteobacteria bacterium]